MHYLLSHTHMRTQIHACTHARTQPQYEHRSWQCSACCSVQHTYKVEQPRVARLRFRFDKLHCKVCVSCTQLVQVHRLLDYRSVCKQRQHPIFVGVLVGSPCEMEINGWERAQASER